MRALCVFSDVPSALAAGFHHILGHVLADLELADRRAMHFVRAVSQTQGALHGVPVGQREVVGNPSAAVNLDGAVNHFQRHVRCDHLDLGDLTGGNLVTHGVHHVRRVQRQQTCHVDFHARVGDVINVAAQTRQRFAKGGAADGALAHQLQCALGHADGAHAVVNTAWAKATLGNFEATALTQQHVFVRYTDVFEQYFGMAVRCIVVTEHRQRTQHFHAGGVHRHQNHRVLCMARAIRIGQAHEDHDFAARVASARCPPFAAVDHPLIALAHGAGLHIGGIGGRYTGLGHGEGGTDGAVQQRLEPLLFLRFVGIAHQHFHVAGIRRSAVERLGTDQRAAHDFRQRRVFSVGQAGTQLGLRQKQVPQAFGFSLGFQLFHDRSGLPAIAFIDLLLEHGFGWIDMGLHKRGDALTQLLNLGGVGEIHDGYLLTLIFGEFGEVEMMLEQGLGFI
ncbi:hypothetical protein PSEUDO9AZ_20004 [Pseudomonas sp. 9AZ]|nr:hypothetical protein PSEUDO9AZ_20004 [Pseudomonas sp. 9AZ]